MLNAPNKCCAFVQPEENVIFEDLFDNLDLTNDYQGLGILTSEFDLSDILTL